MSKGLYEAISIVRKLVKAGFQAYLVGGCVRDQLLGVSPKDYDIATDALPEQVIQLFPNGDLVGAAFGVVIINGIEVATFRSDGQYSDGRRPDQVKFERNPLEDSKRRDFTINAMFYDPLSQILLDYHNGAKDLKDKIIRTVGNPHERFEEDFLRMLRAIRFAVRFGFELDEETFFAIEANAGNIRGVAKERVLEELKRTLAGENRITNAILYLRDSDLLNYIIPELYTISDESFERLIEAGDNLKDDDPIVNFAFLFYFIPPDRVENRLREMKFSNDDRERIMKILDLIWRIKEVVPLPYYAPRGHITKRIAREAEFDVALKIYGALANAMVPDTSIPIYVGFLYLKMRFTENELFPPKLIDGDDLISLGIPQGPIYKKILTEVEDCQLRGDINTRQQALDIAFLMTLKTA